MIPALLITIACEVAASSLYPHYYLTVRRPFLWRDVPLQICANLTFQAQDWGYDVSPLSNGPFWSLSFECVYYAVYGLMFYGVRGSKPLCILILILAGPSIALMLPVWLLGCWSFDAYRKLRSSPRGIPLSSVTLGVIIVVSIAARVKLREALLAINEAHRTAWLSRMLLHAPGHHIVFEGDRVPWLSSASASFFVVGIATAAFTTWALLVVEPIGIDMGGLFPRGIRLLANSTFALYLMHLPLLILIVCALGHPIGSWGPAALVLSLIITTCACLAIPLDGLKRYLRRRMTAPAMQ